MLYAHGAIMGLGRRLPAPVDLRGGRVHERARTRLGRGPRGRARPAGRPAAAPGSPTASAGRRGPARPGPGGRVRCVAHHRVGRAHLGPGRTPGRAGGRRPRRGGRARPGRDRGRLGALRAGPAVSAGRAAAPGPDHGRRAARRARPDAGADADGQARQRAAAPHRPTLRERGAELLERSRDVWNDEDAHPAYERILDELAPDEARVLLLLLQGGPQPERRRPHRRADRHGQQPADRAGADDDRRPGRLPLPRPGAVVPQQPVPARPGVVLAGDAARPAWSTRSSRPSPTCSRPCTR